MPSGKGTLNPNRNAKPLLVIRRHPGIRRNVGDSEKDTIVRGFWCRICGLFAEQIRKRWLYLIRL